jgi:hypothetical protein
MFNLQVQVNNSCHDSTWRSVRDWGNKDSSKFNPCVLRQETGVTFTKSHQGKQGKDTQTLPEPRSTSPRNETSTATQSSFSSSLTSNARRSRPTDKLSTKPDGSFKNYSLTNSGLQAFPQSSGVSSIMKTCKVICGEFRPLYIAAVALSIELPDLASILETKVCERRTLPTCSSSTTKKR